MLGFYRTGRFNQTKIFRVFKRSVSSATSRRWEIRVDYRNSDKIASYLSDYGLVYKLNCICVSDTGEPIEIIATCGDPFVKEYPLSGLIEGIETTFSRPVLILEDPKVRSRVLPVRRDKFMNKNEWKSAARQFQKQKLEFEKLARGSGCESQIDKLPRVIG